MANRFVYLVRHGEANEDGGLTEAGRHQATLVGARLSEVPLSAIHHGPLPRAAQTARLVSAELPAVPIYQSDLVGDYLPAAPDPEELPAEYATLIDSYSAAERTEGPALAAAAIRWHTATTEQDTHELIVTHAFLIAWFVRHALDAPSWRWMGLNSCNGALTVIRYRPALPPSLMTFNDMSHLPPELRWTGFPPQLRP